MFISALFAIANICKQPKCPIDKDVVCVYIFIYTAIEKNGILPIAITWMDLDGIMLS